MRRKHPFTQLTEIMKNPRPFATVARVVFTAVSISALIVAGLSTGCGRNETQPQINSANESSLPLVNKIQKEPAGQQAPPATNTELVQNPVSQTTIVTPQPALRTSLPPSAARPYTVVRGDTMHKIARANGVSFSAMLHTNPKIDPSKLRAGQKIQIPSTGASSSVDIGFREPTKPGDSAASRAGNIHVVKAGETLTKIAQQHNCAVKAIQSVNGQKTTRLLVGQKLRLPGPTQSAISATSPKTNMVSVISANSTEQLSR